MPNQGNLLSKTLVIVILILFIGMSVVSSTGYNAMISNLFGINSKMDSATFLLDENFSGAFPPDGWSTDSWTQCNSSYCSPDPPCAFLYKYNQDDNYDAYITSKAVDASECVSLLLKFSSAGDMSYPQYCSFYVKYRRNETSSWTDITPWDNPLSEDMEWDNYKIEIISGPEGCGDAFQINWTYIGFYYYYNYFYLDDVQILDNNPPYEPSNPDPPDGATNVSNATFCWTGGDPDGDDVIYDVYFGKSSPPPKVASNQSWNCTVPHGSPEWNTTYYWKIVAWDEHGASTEGPIWSFTTRGNSPPNLIYIYPENGSTEVPIDIKLTWGCIDPDGDNVTFDVYFGNSSPPPKIISNQSTPDIDLGILEFDTTYYWKIVAWDEYGAFTEGPIWSFTTEQGCNLPPDAPIIEGPKCGDPGVEYCFTFVADDFEEDDVKYEIYWGDDTFDDFGPFPSGKEVNACHSWDSKGVYYITARAIDTEGKVGDWSDPYKIVIGNEPPDVPDIRGSHSGKIGVEYNFTFVTEDPDGDNVTYEINWGDNTSEEKGPYSSSVEIFVNHTWEKPGRYRIKVRAKDEFCGFYSNWAEFEVEIPRNRATTSSLFHWFLEHFPLLEVFLRAMNLLR